MAILVDYSGIAIANLFAQKAEINESMVRHMILNSLRMYNVRYRKQYGQMILACDGGAVWRKDLYPHYKAHRAKNREESGVDWKEFFRILALVRDEIRDNIPMQVIHIQGVEADDVISTLVEQTQEFGKAEDIMIISADKDFRQLQQYSNVSQFSPMTKTLIKETDPISTLYEQIFRGDKGDGVPNVLSGDRTFVDNERQKTLSSKKVDEWQLNRNRLQEVMDTETYRNFQRNQQMIDLSKIPEAKKLQIINTSVTSRSKLSNNTLNYLIDKRCSQLIECASEFNHA